jgi:hypothetical protein
MAKKGSNETYEYVVSENSNQRMTRPYHMNLPKTTALEWKVLRLPY